MSINSSINYKDLAVSIMAYFTNTNVPKDTPVICYYCGNKNNPNKIREYAGRYVNNVYINDTPICPDCNIDSLIYYDKIPGETDDDKQEVLMKINKVMFGRQKY